MVDPKRLIESMELCRGDDRDCQRCMYWETKNDCRDSMIHDAVDVIKVLAQIEWERDVALNQLRQIGKWLGEKMDDIVELLKKDEPVPTYEHHGLIHCGGCDHVLMISGKKPDPRWKYCAYCGRKVKWDDCQ